MTPITSPDNQSRTDVINLEVDLNIWIALPTLTFFCSIRYVSMVRMRSTTLSKGPLALWSPIRSRISANASRGWRPPLWGRPTIRCTSSIQSGHISVGENEGIVYVNSERQVMARYHVYAPLTSSRYISAPITMAAAGTPQSYPASRGVFDTSQQPRTSGS